MPPSFMESVDGDTALLLRTLCATRVPLTNMTKAESDFKQLMEASAGELIDIHSHKEIVQWIGRQALVFSAYP